MVPDAIPRIWLRNTWVPANRVMAVAAISPSIQAVRVLIGGTPVALCWPTDPPPLTPIHRGCTIELQDSHSQIPARLPPVCLRLDGCIREPVLNRRRLRRSFELRIGSSLRHAGHFGNGIAAQFRLVGWENVRLLERRALELKRGSGLRQAGVQGHSEATQFRVMGRVDVGLLHRGTVELRSGRNQVAT